MLSLIRFQTLRSLRHRNFRLLLIGALLSNAGDFMQNVAQSWLVWQLTRSALLLGIVGFFDSIPRLFLGAIGGARLGAIGGASPPGLGKLEGGATAAWFGAAATRCARGPVRRPRSACKGV